jgi:hypothetical protein
MPEEAFQKIYGFLNTIPRIHAKNESEIRNFREAILYLSRTGCQVRMLTLFENKWNKEKGEKNSIGEWIIFNFCRRGVGSREQLR